MDRKWLAVLAAVAVYCAFLFAFAGCGGGGGGGGEGGGSVLPVGGLPEYNWSNHFGGGTGITAARGIAVDTEGNIYIGGQFEQMVNFAADFGGTETKTSDGGADIFITKINASRNHSWTRRIGGPGNDAAYGIAVDASGNIYIAGCFRNAVNFQKDFNAADPKTSVGGTDIFITKINANGNYGWTKTIGGTANDVAYGIAVDTLGNVYIAGGFEGTVNFAAGFTGTENKSSGGGADIFVTKINADGTYGWTKTIGGNGNDVAYGIAVDSSDNVYITGYFRNAVNFGADFGATDNKTSFGGTEDIFITKINANGTYGWTKTIGGTGDDVAYGIAVDTSGNIYITGSFQGSPDFAADFSGGADEISSNGHDDIFLTKVTGNGDYGWTRGMGGSGIDRADAIAVDGAGNIYLGGSFEQTVNFAAGFGGSDSKISAGSTDIFITKINQDGTYGWTRRIGGGDDDQGLGITLNQTGTLYMTGAFAGNVNFGSDFGKSNYKNSAGIVDAFLTKITP